MCMPPVHLQHSQLSTFCSSRGHDLIRLATRQPLALLPKTSQAAAADTKLSLLLVCLTALQGIRQSLLLSFIFLVLFLKLCLTMNLCDVLLQYVPLLRRSFQMYGELERETKQVNRVVGSKTRLSVRLWHAVRCYGVVCAAVVARTGHCMHWATLVRLSEVC